MTKLLQILIIIGSCLSATTTTTEGRNIGDWKEARSPQHLRITPDQSKRIWIALRQQNLDLLNKKFWSVSDPTSADYGKYLTQSEITELVAPDNLIIQKVVKWLLENEAQRVELVKNRDVIIADFTVQNIEKAFNIQLKRYIHPSGKTILRSSTPPALPSNISPHIHLIHGLEDFPPLSKQPRSSSRSKSFALSPKPKMTEFSKDNINRMNIHSWLDQSNPSEPGVPLIINVGSLFSFSDLGVVYAPFCLNGQFSKTYNCNNTMVSIKLSAHYKDINYYENIVVPDPDNCEQEANGYLICFISVEVQTYEYLTGIKLTVQYKNSNSSKSSVYPFPSASSPPIIPQTLYSLYGIPSGYRVTNPHYKQCVVEFEQQYYSPDDLSFFFQQMGIEGQNTPVTVIGPNDPDNAGDEASLDIQWIMAMAPGVPTVFWSIKANSTEEIDDILKWAYDIGNTVDPPIVNSLSYGMAAEAVDQFLGVGYLERSNIEFQKLALQGISIIIADGDTGAGDLGDPPMSMPTCNKLHPDWPSESAYITAIGSTYMTPLAHPICYLPDYEGGIDCSNNQPIGEVGVSLENGMEWTTGGGFADTQSRPYYQDSFVKAYLAKTSLPPLSVFNITGRAYPDFSTIGHNLLTVIDGEVIPIDGTSASAPIFAGIISLLNEIRAENGKPPLGFMNPLLYQIQKNNPLAFNDIVLGSNRCGVYSTNAIPSCCTFGFHAELGWDAVTGLGSPNFPVLAQEVLKY